MAFRPAGMQNIARFNSSVSSDILELFESAWDKQIKEKTEKPHHKTFAPSSMRCKRLQWFRLRGSDPDVLNIPDRSLDFTAKMGTACHSMIQELLSTVLGADWIDPKQYLENNPPQYEYTLEKSGYETQIEVKNPPIRFACDGIIFWKGKYYLLEIKSSEFGSFNDLTEPKYNHIDQVKAYCALFGIKDVIFTYVDRQYGSIKCYEVNYKDYQLQEVYDMFVDIQRLAEAGVAPEGLPKGDPYCGPSWCPYYKKCKAYGTY